jgi:hypothetical protein
MAKQPKPTPYLITSPGPNVVVWASDVPALKTFFPSATPISSAPGTVKTVSVAGHSARQYPGDTSRISRSGGERQVYPERWLSNNTTPGTVFWCETTTTGPDGKPVKKRKQFTYQGSFGELKAAARQTNPPTPWVLRNASGAAYQIGTATAPVKEPETLPYEDLLG